MSDSTPEGLIKLYAEMAEFTLSECRRCKAPYSCCSPEYCEYAKEYAYKKGVELRTTGHPRLPMMGPGGCIVPPHLRPMCTMHTCDISGFGFKRITEDDPLGCQEWTDKYFDLRARIEIEEMKLMGYQPDL